MLFKQLFDEKSCTYTYLIADLDSKNAILIDPVDTNLDIYIDLLKEHNLTLKYSLETHVHADHITASGLLRQQLGCKTAVSSLCGAKTADIQIQDGDIFEVSQDEYIKAIATPGHTPGSISFLWRDRIFTGDALLINGCGRTDFQGGDASNLYDSITQRIFTLQDDTLIYPGHDYNGRWVSNVRQERSSNSRLANKTREQFIDIMDNLNLPEPKLIDLAVPANRYCGVDPETANQAEIQQTEKVNPMQKHFTVQYLTDEAKRYITEIDVAKVKSTIDLDTICVIDVREQNEVDEGYIDNAQFMPRGVLEFKIDSLEAIKNKSDTILLYCRSGNRSALAAKVLQDMGYSNVLSMAGGYEAWKQHA
ncbi:MAG: MBL fold metallo-hydrolase [Piscirickettsiaceae bacterium]|nr:MBL fold metallo-hydrolase [Piscirickettsiaceae bacterium]